MPIVEPTGKRVLVTGANGYIAMWVVRTLLGQGYIVRATVRSEAKGKHLIHHFRAYGDKLELVVVEDITKDGAFDEAVRDVDAIEHVASPASFNLTDPDAYITPAVRGTLTILESAKNAGNQVKRIVITSSTGAIDIPPTESPVILDETYWNDLPIQLVKEKGAEAPVILKYSASKTLAEKAAWDFYNQHKDEIRWDLVVLNPSLVIGPPLQEPLRTPADLNTSLLVLWTILATERTDQELETTANVIDVRDVAAGHVAALRQEKAGGERIILSSHVSSSQGLRDVAYSLRPELYSQGILPRGNPNVGRNIGYKFNTDKARRVLDIKYVSIRDTILDCLADFEARGWLVQPVGK